MLSAADFNQMLTTKSSAKALHDAHAAFIDDVLIFALFH